MYANERMPATAFSYLIIPFVEVEIYEHNYAKSVNDVVKSRRHSGKTFTTAPTLRLCNSSY